MKMKMVSAARRPPATLKGELQNVLTNTGWVLHGTSGLLATCLDYGVKKKNNQAKLNITKNVKSFPKPV